MLLRTYPNPDLSRPCASFPESELTGPAAERWSSTFHDAVSHLRSWGAYALAAPQVGDHLRWFVVGLHVDLPLWAIGAYINPRMVSTSEDTVSLPEGCLSLPGLRALLVRPRTVRMAWVDGRGVPREAEADGLLARVWLHELDHLSGALMIDRMTKDQLHRIEPALQAMRQGG